MIEIDGAEKSGSGTLVRYAVSLCSLVGEPLHMVRIRAAREKPGLRPQHLQAVRACAGLSGGRLEGDCVGSREIVFHPGKALAGGSRDWDIGTAGSACMMAYTLLPIAIFADSRSRFTIRGGLFQDFAPSALHMQKVLLPLLSSMGVRAAIEIVRPGYVPRGGGELLVSVENLDSPLGPFDRTDPGRMRPIRGIALASHLQREGVSQRMAEQCRASLRENGHQSDVLATDDVTAPQRGAALLLWAESDKGCVIGSDMAGKRGRRSEFMADRVVANLLEDLATGATVDRFAADQMILFAALASGKSRYRVPRLTDHIESNLWLVQKILGARAEIADRLISIDGIGYLRK